MAFINSFLSYLLVYVVFIVCIVAAVLLGIRYRKHKDAKNLEVQTGEAHDTMDVLTDNSNVND